MTPEKVADLTHVADALAGLPQVSLLTADGDMVHLPDELREVLTTAVQALSCGQEVVVATKDSYLTAQEAADFLGVSRPTMIRILDMGEVAYERPNSHRRIKVADLLRYKEKRAERRRVLDGVLAQSDEMDPYDIDHFISTR